MQRLLAFRICHMILDDRFLVRRYPPSLAVFSPCIPSASFQKQGTNKAQVRGLAAPALAGAVKSVLRTQQLAQDPPCDYPDQDCILAVSVQFALSTFGGGNGAFFKQLRSKSSFRTVLKGRESVFTGVSMYF
jgi:hypothetical protein